LRTDVEKNRKVLCENKLVFKLFINILNLNYIVLTLGV